MLKKYLAIVFIMFAVASSASFAAIPQIIGYEGRLTDSSGNPITASTSFNFRIYNQASGGSPVTNGVSSETISPDSNGIFRDRKSVV